MDTDKIKNYTMRISQANRSELVVILFELAVDGIQSAKSALVQGKTEVFDTELKRAQGAVAELRGSLNFQYGVSANLAALYRYINEQLAKSLARQADVNLDSCLDILEKLEESFRQVAKQDTSDPVMENAQQVYAGLTYGKSSLTETTLEADSAHRGFCV